MHAAAEQWEGLGGRIGQSSNRPVLVSRRRPMMACFLSQLPLDCACWSACKRFGWVAATQRQPLASC